MIWFRKKGEWAPSNGPDQVAETQPTTEIVTSDIELEEADEAPLDPVDAPMMYIEKDLAQAVAQSVTEARAEEQAKAQRQYKYIYLSYRHHRQRILRGRLFSYSATLHPDDQ
jgi:hypothetical protein